MQVACKTGGAEQLEKEQKSADGDESDQQGGARRAVFNEEESSGESSMRLPIPQLVNVSEVRGAIFRQIRSFLNIVQKAFEPPTPRF